MLHELTDARISDFQTACAYERVFGSRALTLLRTYGLEGSPARFYLCEKDGCPTAALSLFGGVLTVSANEQAAPEPIAALAQSLGVQEIDTNWEQCEALQKILGGTTDSSYYMVYQGGAQDGVCAPLSPGELHAVFDVLQRSHEYYRTHLRFDPWAADLERRCALGLSELYQLEQDGQVIGTGCIISGDDECGVIGAVAVVPEYRHRGYGLQISRFLVRRILEKGKTPRLISGYDGVARLYEQVGFIACGRWGEWYP
ncbi:GNAT family N-acetyltransferase [Anaerotruncus colihominis]|jgi:GNAT superfamily N-acetyltransferase|uniref:GNAT family N-acetyltransferase n=1 Tax=Anaerotruncus colihominis TaxID=169435 RepID=A0A845RGB6_9FIRM|nr:MULTISPECIES: GNAT family N-acetyltransferase [Anaerotruncus]MCI8492698.1 GNAT family N-acetyltransferase [Anaerotruncus sp.]NBI78824.1 GNAT family N-acetyltransferase [Anaerotruncus colihominis]